MKNKVTILAALLAAASAQAQEPVQLGRASYAAYPPAYKAQTAEHPGFNATRMLTRKLYVNEAPGKPIPTNDWWTDLLASQFSGALWSYPSMLHTSADGVTVSFPTRWSDNGTEVLSDSRVRVGGVKFTASEASALDWHDWDVEVLLPSASGFGSIVATLSHGTPFTWFEFTGVEPELTFSAPAEVKRSESGSALLRVGNDFYGLYFPAGCGLTFVDGALRIEDAGWLSVAPLAAEALYDVFKPYAASVVRNTEVSWDYNERTSLLTTAWHVSAENLREPGASAPVMQGFLPHAYRHAVQSTIDYAEGADYLTPRGTLRMASAADGKFSYSYRFSGMLPYYAAPADARFDAGRMRALMEQYAAGGQFGEDTYWGGKGLTQMALNMTFAAQTGHTDIYEQSKTKLRAALTDWLTYTPGEPTKFFAYYPRWGGMLGFDVSYDSDAFNDHHFHYGYFIYAAALLCMEDKAFAEAYGEILRMIVKDYANYDREDTSFPFLRTLDPWAGHSYAGGLGDAGNDNGNGQESSSEAMQGWGGMYLLGVALGDTAMRDAGIFGWLTESRGVAEYWFDRSRSNYDYSRYEHPYNTNLTSKGIGWWTWFSGDPLWMHSIQWMPVSPCLNYLSEDLDFVKWDYGQMMGTTAYGWFDGQEPLAQQSVGNVVLCYMERYDPEGAAEIFDEAYDRGMGIARNVDTGHISYYVIHNHLTYGDIDFSVTADCPTANAYVRNDGTQTFMVYNPDSRTRTVTFYRDGVALRSVNAPAGKLTAFTAPSEAMDLVIDSSNGLILPPGSSTVLSVGLLDQYGAELLPEQVTFTVSGVASLTGGRLTVPQTAARGSRFTVTATANGLEATAVFTVNDKPVVKSATIAGLPALLEVNTPCAPELVCIDQYGEETRPEAVWTVNGCEVEPVLTFARPGVYELVAQSGGTRAETQVTVLPVLPDVAGSGKASASSQENVGTAPANAIDGNADTRWGSAHTDSEWFMVDLGRQHKITSVTINWETAYAADYDVEVSANATDWTTAHAQRGLSSAGKIRHAVSTEGRYVRVACMRRATQYGYSIIDLEVGGIDAATSPSAPVGLAIEAPQILAEGQPGEVRATAFTLSGSPCEVDDVRWSSEPEGIFQGGTFTPQTYGEHLLKAESGSLVATARVLVEESVKLASLSVTPAAAMILTGDELEVKAVGQNQFGGEYPLDAASLTVTVAPEGAGYDASTGVFKADKRGDYTLDFNHGMATALIQVRDVAEANLAAGKPARASSAEGGNIAAMAVDLNPETRWESAHADNEWLAVDLGSAFVLNKVVINWEGAYATDYVMETSLDGDLWFPAATVANGKGGREEVALPGVPASAVRLRCLKRATVYGNSVYELEVYGSERFSASDPGVAPRIEAFDVTDGNGSVAGEVTGSEPAFVTVVLTDAGGEAREPVRGYGQSVAFAFGNLLSGTYRLDAEVADAFGNRVTETRTVDVIYSLDGVNIALGKPASATSAENAGLEAGNAVDGDTGTRWGSRFADGESLTVDLVDTYVLERIRIDWNQPAFATDYKVEASADGVTFATVLERQNWDGKPDNATIVPVTARYVRVTGLRRATQYGTSINELEVYASKILPPQSALGSVAAPRHETAGSLFDLQGRPAAVKAKGILVSGAGEKMLRR